MHLTDAISVGRGLPCLDLMRFNACSRFELPRASTLPWAETVLRT